MRLSYYGGGHYDSLVNDSDEFDPLADPGSRELLALQKARARKTNADASSALAVSDAEATERAAVEQALSASRAAYDGASDLEAALQASLSAQREAETSDLQSELDAAALRRAEDDDLARAIALSSDAAPQQGDADLAPNADEVSDARFLTADELRAMLNEDGLKWSPWFVGIMERGGWEWWANLGEAMRVGSKYADDRIVYFDPPAEHVAAYNLPSPGRSTGVRKLAAKPA